MTNPHFLIYEYSSGMLNSKTRELVALQAEAQARLAETRRAFLDGMKIAKEVKSDLDYVHRKVKCAIPISRTVSIAVLTRVPW